MARKAPFEISTPGTLVGLVIGLDALAGDVTAGTGDFAATVTASASNDNLTVVSPSVTVVAKTVDGVEYAAGKAITFDLAAASDMTPSAPPTTEYEIYFDITTTGGEAHRIKKTVTVETRLEAL